MVIMLATIALILAQATQGDPAVRATGAAAARSSSR